jgi:hypothetical protein
MELFRGGGGVFIACGDAASQKFADLVVQLIRQWNSSGEWHGLEWWHVGHG